MGINCTFFFQAHWRDPWRPKGIVQDNLGNISEDAHRHGCWSRSFHWSESILQCFLCGTYFSQTNQHAHLWLEKGDLLKLIWSFNLWINPLSANSDQHQFSPNDIHRLSRAKSKRINKWSQREKSLIFYQILSTNFLTKCMEISLENLYVDIGA